MEDKKEFFKKQMTRIKSCSNVSINEELLRLVWAEVKHVKEKTIKEMADYFIGENMPIKISKVREFINTKKEQTYFTEKKLEKIEKTMSNEEISNNIKMILKRISIPSGTNPEFDKEWDKFNKSKK